MQTGSIKNAVSKVKVTGESYLGGLIGMNVGTLVVDNVDVGVDVSGTQGSLGGIAGQNSGSTMSITNATLKGSVTSSTTNNLVSEVYLAITPIL